MRLNSLIDQMVHMQPL